MINAPTNINQSSTYDELSKQFKELYPAAYRAFQLIPLMYNRLTLVDNFSHKAALKKMYNDHKDLPGFSSRGIYLTKILKFPAELRHDVIIPVILNQNQAQN